MASKAAIPRENAPPEMPGGAALQHRQWNSRRQLSRALAAFEGFLSHSGFDRGPWLVVAFGAGIGAWFALPSQGHWGVLCLLCLCLCLAARHRWARCGPYHYVSQALFWVPLLVAAGCIVVWARSALVGEPPIERPVAGTFAGRILSVEAQPAQHRTRFVVAMRAPDTGRVIKVRLNLSEDFRAEPPPVGSLVRVKARLMPPAGPMVPGSYDFARAAWFSGLAASGTARHLV